MFPSCLPLFAPFTDIGEKHLLGYLLAKGELAKGEFGDVKFRFGLKSSMLNWGPVSGSKSSTCSMMD